MLSSNASQPAGVYQRLDGGPGQSNSYMPSQHATSNTSSPSTSLAPSLYAPSQGAAGGASNAAQPQHPPPLAPYPPQQAALSLPPPSQAPQSQIICSGCRTLLVYPQNATNVRCALCHTITAALPSGMESAQLLCGGCRTLLMYARGATSVQCSICHTVNLAHDANSVAHINCSGCSTTLMYPFGAQSVKCSICQVVTNVAVGTMRMPLPAQRPYLPSPQHSPAASYQPSGPSPVHRSPTVVVENPKSVDESGNMVSNIAVGVSTDVK